MNMFHSISASSRGKGAYLLSALFVVLTGAALFVFTDSANAQSAAPTVPAPASGVPKALPANHLLDVLNKAKPTLSSSDASEFSGTVKIGGATAVTRSALQIAKLDLIISDEGALTELLRLTRANRNTWRFGMQADQALLLYPTNQVSIENPDFHIANSSGTPFATFSPDTGSVGIGTTNPQGQLTISRDTASSAAQLELRDTGGINDGQYNALRFTQGVTGSTPLGSIRAMYRNSGNPDLAFFTRDYNTNVETEKMRIGSNGNVGIGTPSPADVLTITKPEAFITTKSTDTTKSALLRMYGFNGEVEIQAEAGRGGTKTADIQTWTNHPLWFGTNNIERMRIDTNGNVGIGTPSPDSGMKLDVRGNVRIGDGSTEEQDIHFLNNRGQWEVGTNNVGNGTNSNHFYIYDTDYRFTVQRGTGNVGIGTRSPNDKLQIGNALAFHDGGHKLFGFGFTPGNGKATMDGYPAEIRFIPDNYSGGPSLRIGMDDTKRRAGNDTSAWWKWGLTLVPGGNVGIGSGHPPFPLTITKNGNGRNSYGKTKNIQLMVNGTNQTGGGIAVSDDGGFFDWNDGFITYEPLCCGQGLRVNSKFVAEGDVRIGNTADRHYLEVSSKEWPEVRFTTPTRSSDMRIGMAHAANGHYGVNEGDFYIYSPQTNRMDFMALRNGGISMVPKDGNVGIGTTSPGLKLSVAGGWLGSEGDWNTSGGFRLGRWPGSGSGNSWVYLSRANSASYADLAVGSLWTSGTTYLGMGGNVGVGVAPSEKLHVQGRILSSLSSNEGGQIALGNPSKSGTNASTWALYNMTGGYGNGFEIWSYPANGKPACCISRFTIKDDGTTILGENGGYVGIGTNDPQGTLHVKGPGESGVAILGSFIYSTSGSTFGGPLYLNITQGDIITSINTDQKVGIGTTKPDGKLVVAGDGPGGTIRVRPSSDGGESSIGFKQNSNGSGVEWVMGQNSWGAGSGHFAIGGNGSGRLYIKNDGRVGIGVSDPITNLVVGGSSNSNIILDVRPGNKRYSGIVFRGTFDNYPVDTVPRNVAAIQGGFHTGTWDKGYLAFRVAGSDAGCVNDSASAYPCVRMFITNNGNVGIGTNDPRAKLDVNGNANFVGSVNVAFNPGEKIAYDQSVRGLDVAENFVTDVDVSPGDIVVTSGADHMLTPSSSSYQKGIIGVVSTAPAILFEGDHMKFAAHSNFKKGTKPPVALAGRVPIKVTMEGGSIKPGDYLTTSTTPGHAMKANLPGPTIGIALEKYDGPADGFIIVFMNVGDKNVDVLAHEMEALKKTNLDLKERLQRIEQIVKKIRW